MGNESDERNHRSTRLSGAGCFRLGCGTNVICKVLCLIMLLGNAVWKMMCLLMRNVCAICMDGSVYPSVSVLIMCNGWGEQREEQECMCVRVVTLWCMGNSVGWLWCSWITFRYCQLEKKRLFLLSWIHFSSYLFSALCQIRQRKLSQAGLYWWGNNSLSCLAFP